MRGLLRELRRQAAILVFGGYPSAVRAVSGPDSSWSGAAAARQRWWSALVPGVGVSAGYAAKARGA